jgi:hypothetical protein
LQAQSNGHLLYCFVAFHSAKLNFSLLNASPRGLAAAILIKKRSVDAERLIWRYGFFAPVSLERGPSVFVYVTEANFELDVLVLK